MRQRIVTATVGVVVLLAIAQLLALLTYDDHGDAKSPHEYGIAAVPALLRDQRSEHPRNVDVYRGYGAWVDVYDFASGFAGDDPSVTPDDIEQMARHGVRTLYLQAAQLDPRSPDLLADPDKLGRFLLRAHSAGIRVVGWYLPRFTDLDRDLDHLQAIADFKVLGHRFDGIAVDIEWTEGVADAEARSSALLRLSRKLRLETDSVALGAIVLPPVQIEEVNPHKWPDFPWEELGRYYDVWLPMGYWTQRDPASGLNDGRDYTTENVRRVRENLDDPEAEVHPIGGLGADVTRQHAEGFAAAVEETDALGGSVYDWATLDSSMHEHISAGLADAHDSSQS